MNMAPYRHTVHIPGDKMNLKTTLYTYPSDSYIYIYFDKVFILQEYAPYSGDRMSKYNRLEFK